jgi:uncharacterized beta-barrel protein YwiB (DUF1934 family)
MLKKIRMKLESVQYDPPDPTGQDGECQEEPLRLVQHLDARLRETADEIFITYDEPDEDATGRVQVQLCFRKDDPGTVTLSRSGLQRYVLVFSEGQRCASEYAIGGMHMDLVVVTKRLSNRIMSHGKLHLEYSLELQGCANGRRIIDIRLDPPKSPLCEY